jgi:hypothetical protein
LKRGKFLDGRFGGRRTVGKRGSDVGFKAEQAQKTNTNQIETMSGLHHEV